MCGFFTKQLLVGVGSSLIRSLIGGSSLTDIYHKDKDSDSTASTRVPRHNYNLRSQQQKNLRDYNL